MPEALQQPPRYFFETYLFEKIREGLALVLKEFELGEPLLEQLEANTKHAVAQLIQTEIPDPNLRWNAINNLHQQLINEHATKNFTRSNNIVAVCHTNLFQAVLFTVHYLQYTVSITYPISHSQYTLFKIPDARPPPPHHRQKAPTTER